MQIDTMPVLVGVGQVTEKGVPLEDSSSQPDLIEQACRLALADAGVTSARFAEIEACVLVRSFRESTHNAPELICKRLGMTQAEQWLTPHGGYAPQYLVNHFAAEITAGKKEFVLLAGAEARDTVRRFMKQGDPPDWNEASASDPQEIFTSQPLFTDHEADYGLLPPSHVYPLFENALRHHYGDSIDAHQRAMGALFARFTESAADSPYAWFRDRRTAAEIATPTADNRFIGWPYTKLMNAMNTINQSAAVVLMAQGKARTLGVDLDKCVYLHGCADLAELWNVTERVNYHSSPAIRLMGEKALAMAERSIDEIDWLDLYSCFPSAVQIGRDELGIAKTDPRPLTVTGGLPYHGGAGNNYVMNAIAAMVEKLRAHRGAFGLVTGNGGYLTKHSAGIYSTTPPAQLKMREDPSRYQGAIDALARPPFTESPHGKAVVETYTVLFDRDNAPEKAIIIGREGDAMTPDAPRFLAHSVDDPALLRAMTQSDYIGRKGRVAQHGGKNIFAFDA